MDVPFLIWSEALAVGHESLDAEHRSLVEALNGINAGLRAGQTSDQIRPLLDALKSLAEDHARHEDWILRRLNAGPLPSVVDRQAFLRALVGVDIAAHTTGHVHWLAKLNRIIQGFDHPGLDHPGVGHQCGSAGRPLSSDLNAWFLDHVDKHEAPLRAVFQALPNRPSNSNADGHGGKFAGPA
jgi:hemerythrin